MMDRNSESQARPDPREAELVNTMVLDSMEYIHGKGTDEIVKALKNSTDSAATMAAIAYKVVKGVADKNRATARVEMDMDMLMGVATEAIDMVTEVAEAADQIMPGSNVAQLKEDTLLRLTMIHGEQLGELNPEQKEQAKIDLRDYMSDGGTQKAFDYINDRSKKEGLNPYDMMRAGNKRVTGYERPIRDSLAEGVSKGLMSQGGAAPGAAPPAQVEGSDQGPPPAPPTSTAPGLMPAPPQEPIPLPTGEGLIPSGLPPAQDPNAAILPPGDGRR